MSEEASIDENLQAQDGSNGFVPFQSLFAVLQYQCCVVIVRIIIFSISYGFSVFAQNVLVLVLVLIRDKIVSLVKGKINGFGISIS